MARIPDNSPLTNIEMWENSELVAIVQINQGTFDASTYSYNVKASIIVSLKGNEEKSIQFDDSWPYQYTEKLGGYYLVYLSRVADKLSTIKNDSSVVELREADSFYQTEVKELMKQKGIPLNSLFSYKSYLWIIEECFQKTSDCKRSVASTEQAFNKARQNHPAGWTR